MKKLLLVFLALSLVLFFVAMASASAQSETVKGWVSDTKCAAKGAGPGHEACTKKCIAAGEKMVIVTDKDSKVLMVSNSNALTGHEGHHVEVKGMVSGDSINVQPDSIKMLGQ